MHEMKSSKLQLKRKGGDDEPLPRPHAQREELPAATAAIAPSPLIITTITNIRTGEELPVSGLAHLVELLCSPSRNGNCSSLAPFPPPTLEPAGSPASAGSSSGWEQFAQLAFPGAQHSGQWGAAAAAAAVPAAAVPPFPGFDWAASSASIDEEPQKPGAEPAAPSAPTTAAPEAPPAHRAPAPPSSHRPAAAPAAGRPADAATASKWQQFMPGASKASGRGVAAAAGVAAPGSVARPPVSMPAAGQPANTAISGPNPVSGQQQLAAQLPCPQQGEQPQHAEPQPSSRALPPLQAPPTVAALALQQPQPAPRAPPVAASFQPPQWEQPAPSIQQQQQWQQLALPFHQPPGPSQHQVPPAMHLHHQAAPSTGGTASPYQQAVQQPTGMVPTAAPLAAQPGPYPMHQQNQPHTSSGGATLALSTCPICGKPFSAGDSNAEINAHIDECLSMAASDDF